MSDPVVLKQKAEDGELLEAVFMPQSGMNLISFKKGAREAIDPSVREAAAKGSVGSGGIIGPHFQSRTPSLIPTLKNPQAFSHWTELQKQGVNDPFFNGVGLYAPWTAQQTETRLTATLSGKENWNEESLSALAGQNFKMTVEAELKSDGLHLFLAVVSDSDSLIGIDYRYALPEGKGKVVSGVKKHYYKNNQLEEIPPSWSYSSNGTLHVDLQESTQAAFHPSNPLEGKIKLETSSHTLHLQYKSICQENAWFLSHASKAPFVQLIPLSSQNPWRPNLSVSSLSIHLKIE